MTEELNEPQGAYLEVVAHVAVLNLLVAQLCAWFILETEDPKTTANTLEIDVRESIRQSLVENPDTEKYLSHLLKAHQDALNLLFESIHTRVDLASEKPSDS
ncbi:MAG: hypothetical protein OXC42_08995 [Gammaproteobacteria bacterium]|nr:hypothetical protein [Gammaproteobacteria bacterium]